MWLSRICLSHTRLAYHPNSRRTMAAFRKMRGRCLRMSLGKIIIFLVLILIVLQLLHMSLLSRLEGRKLKEDHEMKLLQNASVVLFKSLQASIAESQIVDSSGEYKIVNYLHEAEKFRSKGMEKPELQKQVTLVTQSSFHNLYHLVKLSTFWGGPIGVTVFASEDLISQTVSTLVFLLQCSHTVRQHVSFHLAYPFAASKNPMPFNISALHHLSCDTMEIDLKKASLKKKNYALGGLAYPNNFLRNVACRNAKTKYVLVVDIDMIPSQSLSSDFAYFASRHFLSESKQIVDDQTVFVVPAFELESNLPIPQDKATLLLFWERRLVRPFYEELCSKCQAPTDFVSWRNLTGTTQLEIAYEVEWKDPWEPFFIAPKAMPMYDERFKQYGFNRISQVCELHIAGYKFVVLNNAFLLHKGFKRQEGFHMSKEVEQERNRVLFRQFKQELKTKYPESEKRCY